MNRLAQIGSLLIVSGLCACTNLPTPDYVTDKDKPSITVDDLISHIQCEVYLAKLDAGNKLIDANNHDNSYVAQVTLTLKVEDNGGITPALSFINPLKSPATRMFNVDANVNIDRQRTFTTAYTIDLDKLDDKSLVGTPSPCGKNETLSLSGDLGIPGIVDGGLAAIAHRNVNVPQSSSGSGGKGGSTVNLTVYVNDRGTSPPTVTVPPSDSTKKKACEPPDNDKPKCAALPTFGTTVQFTVLKSADFGPTWSLVHFKGPNGSKGVLNGGITNTDTLIIAFAPASLAGSKALSAAMLSLDAAVAARDASLKALRDFRAGPHATHAMKAMSVERSALQSADARAALAVKAEQERLERAKAEQVESDATSKADAAAAAQAFTTNIILQNLAGSLPTQQ